MWIVPARGLGETGLCLGMGQGLAERLPASNAGPGGAETLV